MLRHELFETYKDKRVLVTGHTGFKGSWLSIWLKELGADVVGYSLSPPTELNNFEACNLTRHITHVHGDIRDLQQILNVFKNHQPEIVFHLAAQAIVRDSYIDPKLTFDTNVGGTVNLLEAARQIKSVRAFINVTSDKCYENKEWVWGYRENDPVGGRDPYSASKGCCELVFSSYWKSFFSVINHRKIGLASVRAGNVIGGGDWANNRLVPDCVRALTAKQPVVIRNPDAIRPWQHVLEPLGAYLLLCARLYKYPEKFSGAWNFGPEDSNYLTVGNVVRKFIGLWGLDQGREISRELSDLHEAILLKLCCDKAKALLGWKSILNIDESLQFTAEWYKEFYKDKSGRDSYQICKHQIEHYMKKAGECYVKSDQKTIERDKD